MPITLVKQHTTRAQQTMNHTSTMASKKRPYFAILMVLSLMSKEVSCTEHDDQSLLRRRDESVALTWIIEPSHEFSYRKQDLNGPDHWYTVKLHNQGRWNTSPSLDDYNHCNMLPIESPINVVANSECQRQRPMKIYTPQQDSCTIDNISFDVTPFGVRALLLEQCQPPTIVLASGTEAVVWTFTGIQLKMRSEHTLEGVQFDGELVLTHSHKSRGTMHISIMLDASSLTPEERMESLITRWEQSARKSRTLCQKETTRLTTTNYPPGGPFPYDIMTSQSYFEYDGTLTVPPCTPNVRWILLDKPLKVSKAQYKRLAMLMTQWMDPSTCREHDTALAETGENVRPLQDGKQISVAYCA